MSSAIRHSVCGKTVDDICKDSTACIFRVKQYNKTDMHCLNLKMKVLRSFETTGDICFITSRNSPEDLHLQVTSIEKFITVFILKNLHRNTQGVAKVI